MPRLRRMSVSSIESLENRICPAVTFVQADLDSDGASDDVRIVGGNENSRIDITDEGVGAGSLKVWIDANGDGDYGDAGEISNVLLGIQDDTCIIELKLGGGNDQVSYSLSQDLDRSERTFSIDLGNGNDEFVFSSGGQVIEDNSLLTMNLLAGAGNDNVTIDLPSMLESGVSIDLNMGNGNDDVEFFPLHGISVDSGAICIVNVSTGSGTNTVTGLILADVGVDEEGRIDCTILGGSGVDTVELVTAVAVGNGTSDSVFRLAADLAGGNDKFVVHTPLYSVGLNSAFAVSASGAAGNDVMEVRYFSRIPTQIDGLVQINLRGGKGNDQLGFLAAPDNSQLELDGQLLVNLEGQEGNDSIAANLKVTAPSTGNYSLIALGGSGNDEILLTLLANGAPISLGSAGKLVVDGGHGNDTLSILGVSTSFIEMKLLETVLTA